ncbi:MAG: sortase, partial [Patescibacteria group bacterium]|nr:sortase [Patescibacteria group bacterium]
MEVLIHLAVRLVRAGMRSYAKKWSFLSLFGIIFFGNAFVLAQLNIVPEVPAASNPTVTLAASPLVTADQNGASMHTVSVELPTKISIPAIQLSAAIANPDTTNVEALDTLLLSGAVRYPTSARLGETGNVVLFGHSSYLPIVGNQAYKTFNGIQKLMAGDLVTLYSSDASYTYRVRTVAKESANDAAIPLSVAGRVLTLSTCDSFGTKTDRFVVVADFVE